MHFVIASLGDSAGCLHLYTPILGAVLVVRRRYFEINTSVDFQIDSCNKLAVDVFFKLDNLILFDSANLTETALFVACVVFALFEAFGLCLTAGSASI
mgnify:CR=1 FL=1